MKRTGGRISVEKALARKLSRSKAFGLRLPQAAPAVSAGEVRVLRKNIYALTQLEFAKLCNVRVATVRSWEQGLRTPSDASLRLLQILRLRPELFRMLAD